MPGSKISGAPEKDSFAASIIYVCVHICMYLYMYVFIYLFSYAELSLFTRPFWEGNKDSCDTIQALAFLLFQKHFISNYMKL